MSEARLPKLHYIPTIHYSKHLYDEKGAVRKFLNIYLNDEDIRFMQNLDTEVKSGDSISLVPAIAGGIY